MTSFTQSPKILNHENRITALESDLGSGAPDNWYNTIADIRAITGYSDEDTVGCYANESIYTFDAAETTADDGENYLTPDDIAEPDPGRWVKQKRFSLVGHNHDDKMDKPAAAQQGRIAVFNDSKEVVDSGKLPSEYVEKDGDKVLSDKNYSSSDKTKLINLPTNDELSTSLGNKMNKITGMVAGDVGKMLIVNSEGQAEMLKYKHVQTYNNDDLTSQAIEITHDLNDEEPPAFVFNANHQNINGTECQVQPLDPVDANKVKVVYPPGYTITGSHTIKLLNI
jgi:hypothetical protein